MRKRGRRGRGGRGREGKQRLTTTLGEKKSERNKLTPKGIYILGDGGESSRNFLRGKISADKEEGEKPERAGRIDQKNGPVLKKNRTI